MLALAVIMVTKYVFHKKYRSTKSKGRYLKSFTRWYSSKDKKNEKTPLAKRKYMGVSNILNFLFWFIVILLLLLVLSYCYYNYIY
jgi:hypothetical protein